MSLVFHIMWWTAVVSTYVPMYQKYGIIQSNKFDVFLVKNKKKRGLRLHQSYNTLHRCISYSIQRFLSSFWSVSLYGSYMLSWSDLNNLFRDYNIVVKNNPCQNADILSNKKVFHTRNWIWSVSLYCSYMI